MNKEFLIYLVFQRKSWHAHACSSSRGLCAWMILNDTANRLLTREATSKGLGSKATSHSILNDQVAVGCQPFWADPIRHSDLRTHTETWSDGLIPRQFAPSSPSKKRCLPCVDSMSAVQAVQKHQACELVKHTNLVTQGLAISLPVPCTLPAQLPCVQQNTSHVRCQ